MRTPIHLWLLFSVAVGPALTQAAPDPMRIDPTVQRERDNTRMGILQDERAKEARELETAEADWRNAQVSRAASDKIQEIAARVALHRQNLAALEREIGLTQSKRPTDAAATGGSPEPAFASIVATARERQPDDWLIVRQSSSTTVQNAVPNLLLRRKLPSAQPDASLPQWIIQSGFTGFRP